MDWNPQKSESLYNISNWGTGLFGVNADGNMEVKTPLGNIDLKQLADDLQGRGIELPALVRLTDVLQNRIQKIAEAFNQTITERNYQGHYRGVYPVKVNQQRQLIDEVIQFSKPYHMGLECGSKPELLIVLPRVKDPEALIICNGYKDAEYIEMALLAQKLGRNCVIVVEQAKELDLILKMSKELGIEPQIGVRARLASKGVGRWATSSGDKAKFGLGMSGILRLVQKLEQIEMLHTLKLLHFHIGSQVSNIRAFKGAIKESAYIYSELVNMGAPMGYLDVGGGLGVDYDGTRTDDASSINYDIPEYAHAVVHTIQDICDKKEVPHPNLVTETGRAMVAHSSFLIVPVLDVNSQTRPTEELERIPAKAYGSVDKLKDLFYQLEEDNAQESYHIAAATREECINRFQLGLCSLKERAYVDELYSHLTQKLLSLFPEDDPRHEELEGLHRDLADIYYCNFSVFQSTPDSWAIDQVFPIVPLHRLDEKPTQEGMLADLTCDSDGRINRFVSNWDITRTLPLHEKSEAPYYLGIFLVGAYQEILGDLHNLFGDTNAVHVAAVDNNKGYRILDLVDGDRVHEVLHYVQFDDQKMLGSMRKQVEESFQAGTITLPEGKRLLQTYSKGLNDYTYLNADD
ncbi:MAG: arginine decarboxylase [Myxococcales bacterium]|nr:arginine decarboxylase [Myxococcales bacterium]|tara:strand:- start:5497 stop:7392 length:1896 start_codon:yes stop_codon:yes gene_type:complete